MIHTASIACADLLNLQRDVTDLLEGGINFLHVDIMDGHDVPNLCMNIDHIKQLHALDDRFVIDTHLMVTNPMDYINRCASAGSSYFVTHQSNLPDVNDYIRQVKASGMKVGLVLKVDDPIDMIREYLGELDSVLLMSIVPGDYGRPFDPIVFDKVKELAAIKASKGYGFLIEVDGGVTPERAKQLKEYGADAAVAGVFTIFRQPEGISESIRKLNHFIES